MEHSFAQIIRQIMRERNLTQMELSNILGIRQSQISNWLSGKSLPGYHSLIALSKKLRLPASSFFYPNNV